MNAESIQIRIDPQGAEKVKAIISDVERATGRKLSASMIANMALLIGIPEVRKALVRKPQKQTPK
jgi:hypothetical protein